MLMLLQYTVWSISIILLTPYIIVLHTEILRILTPRTRRAKPQTEALNRISSDASPDSPFSPAQSSSPRAPAAVRRERALRLQKMPQLRRQAHRRALQRHARLCECHRCGWLDIESREMGSRREIESEMESRREMEACERRIVPRGPVRSLQG